MASSTICCRMYNNFDVRFQGGNVVCISIHEVLDRTDCLGIHHETTADLVHLNHGRAAVRSQGGLQLVQAFIVRSLEHALNLNVLVGGIKIGDQLVRDGPELTAHGMPPYDLNGLFGWSRRRQRSFLQRLAYCRKRR